jgi:hypothetical protein
MKTVYIASPYTKGDVAVNVRNSFLMAEKLREAGYLPFCPLWTHFWHFLSPHEYTYWTTMDFEWLKVCDILLRLPGESSGADGEVAYMKKLGKPVFYNLEDLLILDSERGKR